MNFYGFRKINFDDARGKLKRISIVNVPSSVNNIATPLTADAASALGDGKCWEFCHPSFVRGRQDLLKNIKRKTYADASVASKEELDILRSEVEQRTIDIETNESRMKKLESICEDLQSEMRELRLSYERRKRDFDSCGRNAPCFSGEVSFSSHNPTNIGSPGPVAASKLLDDSIANICWRFEEPFDLKLYDTALDTALDLNDSMFADNDDSKTIEASIPGDIFSPSSLEGVLMMSDECESCTPSHEKEFELSTCVEEEEPRAALEATLASMPSQLDQKEFLVKLVNTINEMFPEVGSMFADKDKTKLFRTLNSEPSSPVSGRNRHMSMQTRSTVSKSGTATPAQIEMAQQQAISMMASLLPSIQMALLNVVAASAMTSASLSSSKKASV